MQTKKEINTPWYLLYTNPRAEKKVGAELNHRGFEFYLPMHKTLRQWSDRKKWVEEPLFKSYLFIQIELNRYFYDILNIPGVVKFINFGNTPAVVDPREIELVKMLLKNSTEMEALAEDQLEIGDEVEIISGPLVGKKGTMVNKRGKSCFMMELSSMQQNILISIPKDYLRILKPSENRLLQSSS